MTHTRQQSFLMVPCSFMIALGVSCTGSGSKSLTDTQDETDQGSGESDTEPGEHIDGSSGCGEDPSSLSTTITVGSTTRSFVLYLPSDYDKERDYPLIFAWHGLGGSGALAQYYFGIEEQVGSDGIVVYPNALPRDDSGGETGWELSPYGYDFEFFDAMYAAVTEGLCIDEARVFSTGHSFGGYMSNAMGCYRGEVHNAIAPVAGGPPYYGDCATPVGAWIAHGKADDTVVLSQGETARDRWLFSNECADTTAPTDPSPCVAYDECTKDVHWCQYPGGHEWPSFAGLAIWNFFSAQ